MSQWTGKTKGTALGYRIFIITLDKLGVYPAYGLLIFVALYYFLFSHESFKHVYAFQRKVGRSKLRAIGGVYANFYRLGQTIIDKMMMKKDPQKHFSFNFEGEDNLRNMTLAEEAGIILTAHMGNWEIAGHLLDKLDTKINVLMYDGEYQKVKEVMKEATEKRAFNVIAIKDDFSHIFQISQAIQNHELLCIQGDRYMPQEKALLKHEFFGEEALFPKGPFSMAVRMKVPVSFSFTAKESAKHYYFCATKAKVYGSEQEMLQAYVVALVKMLRKYPEQWFNYFDFWKSHE